MTRRVTETLREMSLELSKQRDGEVMIASEVAEQYVTNHNDGEAYRQIDREVNRLARAWDRMIALLNQTADKAAKIEASCGSFYGDSAK